VAGLCNLVVPRRSDVAELLDHSTLTEMRFGNALRTLHRDARIPHILGIDDNHRPVPALVHAAGVVDADSLLQPGLLHATLELSVDCLGALTWAGLPVSAHEHMTLILPHGPNNSPPANRLLDDQGTLHGAASLCRLFKPGFAMPTPDDFFAIDIRVGTVLDAEPFPEARKPSLKLRIDFGPEIGVKQSSAQLTVWYTPESLVGRQVIAAVNIGSRRIAGFLSEVLVLGAMATPADVVLLRVDRPVENGTRIA
jgi:tRNA-binding protein